MKWHVENLNDDVDKELEALGPSLRAKFIHVAELLETFGPHQVREPYVKHITGKLWEMRLKGKDGIARAIYVTATGKRIVIVHVFVKKTHKTPKSAIKIALKRIKEIRT